MTTLNRDAADALRPFEPNAVTDVTGFGLLGHAHEMAERSGVRIELDAAALPFFPGALEQAAAGVRTGGDSRNRDFAGPHVEADGVPEGAARARLRPADRGRAARLAARRQGRRCLQAEFAVAEALRVPRRTRRRGIGRRCADRTAAPPAAAASRPICS